MKLLKLPLLQALGIVAFVGVTGGCKRQAATVYNAPKEGAPSNVAEPPAPAPHGEGSPLDSTPPAPRQTAPLPRISWKLPAGWKESGPGQMSVASFSIESSDGPASVSITPLPSMTGREGMIVNMWRQQAGAPELEPAEAEKALTTVEAAGKTGKLFEVAAEKEGKKSRIVTAMVDRADGTWFFKLAGADATVAAQKPAFVEFLKGIEFEDKGLSAPAVPGGAPGSALPAMSSGPSVPTAEPSTAFTMPEGWQPLAAGQMQVAKYAVPPKGEAKAEVAVSMFGSDTGGTNANVSRWRRQLGLAEISDAELTALPKPLDASLPGALVADLQNGPRRMVGAIVPREGSWWFYKLTGDAEAVEAARETFLTFAKATPKP